MSNTPVLPPARGIPIPVPKTSTPRPQLTIGASLSSLNAKKPVLGAASSQGSVIKTAVKSMDSDEEESEDEESDDESSESSDEEDAKVVVQAVQPDPQPKSVESTSTSGTTSPTDSSSESDDDSSSDSEDSDAEKTRARSALAAEIGRFVMSESRTSTKGTPIPKMARSRSTEETRPAYLGKSNSQVKGKRKSGDKSKYLSKYSFSQPL